jgi:hypothetical protein
VLAYRTAADVNEKITNLLADAGFIGRRTGTLVIDDDTPTTPIPSGAELAERWANVTVPDLRMKSCRWSLFPDGDFRVKKSDNPNQTTLFGSEVNLDPVRAWVIGKLNQKAMRWQELHAAVREEDWLETHVNEGRQAIED